MKKSLIVSALLSCIASASFAENHVIALAACPPWKGGDTEEQTKQMVEMCAKDASNIVDGLQSAMGVTPENTVLLVQQDATVEKMTAALSQIAEKANPGDTVFFYLAVHGGVLNHAYKGYPVQDEVFAFYSDDEPANYSQAVTDGMWLGARDFRDRISTYTLEHGINIVLIVEACHALASLHDFKHNPILHFGDSGSIASVFSSGEDEISHFNPDFSGGRFTTDLSNALRNASAGEDFYDIVSTAAKSTFRETIEACNSYDEKQRQMLGRNPTTFVEVCVQEPAIFDPSGALLKVLAVN